MEFEILYFLTFGVMIGLWTYSYKFILDEMDEDDEIF